jgi:hypothetical protein
METLAGDSRPKTVHEMIARICESEEVRKMLRIADAPEVGIF